MKNYKPKDLGIFITSRGCPNNCAFCCSESLWGRKVRGRNIEDVVNEIIYVKEKMKVDDVYLIDDTFTYSKKRVLDFCDRIEGKGITWSCLTRFDVVDNVVAESMKKSGCRLIKVGLESGSERVLKLMNKNIKKKDVVNTAKIFNNFNLPWVAYVMAGVPGEFDKDVDETINFLKEIQPSFISVSNFTPYPGTKFYRDLGFNHIEYHKFNHHRLVQTGTVSLDKLIEFATFADEYNSNKNKK